MEEPLARLVAYEPTTLPVVSVYLNTQPDQHGRSPDAMPYLHREFKALARTWAPGSPERHSFDRDVARIASYVAGKTDRPDPHLLQFLDRARDVHDLRHLHVRDGPGRRLRRSGVRLA